MKWQFLSLNMNYFDKTTNRILINDSLPHNFLAEKMNTLEIRPDIIYLYLYREPHVFI